MQCDLYENSKLDANVFTWWQQWPELTNQQVLRHLRQRQQAGEIRQSAMAILLFEQKMRKDEESFARLRNHTSWIEEVPFNEIRLCKRIYRTKCKRANWHKRAYGTYYVAGIKLSSYRPAQYPPHAKGT